VLNAERTADRVRIVVVGLPKSGTTILTYRIAAALPGVHIDFEPPGPPRVPAGHTGPVVTKKLVGAQTADLASFDQYDRRIWICRDPRDFLVSQALYRWHREEEPEPIDVVWFDRILALLEAKEADPGSVAFRDLEPADYFETFDAVAELWQRQPRSAWFLYRYEDMVAGDYRDLERYLGFAIEPTATVGEGLERVERRKGTGDWRHWFTPSDVEHYRSGGLARYLDAFGYDDGDWALAPRPVLDPRFGSDYARSLFTRYRRPTESGPTGADSPPRSRRRRRQVQAVVRRLRAARR
jgi:hypothetical protein